MAYEAHCIVRDYNPQADTVTLELSGIGSIDTWIDGIAVHVAVDRGYLVYGVQGIVTMPDAHRLCEASLTSVYPPTSLKKTVGATLQKTITGRTQVGTDGTGAGSVAVPYGYTYSAVPNVTLSVDRGLGTSLTAVTTTGFTVGVQGSANTSYLVTWTAVGSV